MERKTSNFLLQELSSLDSIFLSTAQNGEDGEGFKVKAMFKKIWTQYDEKILKILTWIASPWKSLFIVIFLLYT